MQAFYLRRKETPISKWGSREIMIALSNAHAYKIAALGSLELRSHEETLGANRTKTSELHCHSVRSPGSYTSKPTTSAEGCSQGFQQQSNLPIGSQPLYLVGEAVGLGWAWPCLPGRLGHEGAESWEVGPW